ncbi:hypothetical protein [Haladaptatus sp. W1]|uniref:hypothetical protein n=1 Tax=Haladaptatus sp. W1 TaxID=1897478 RepID=UPI000B090765|nr:hypothetical protein [Haladaptatus sp. W1]
MEESGWRHGGHAVRHLLDPSLDDDVYRALASRRRRYAVYALMEWDRVSMDELADVLTGWLYASEYRMRRRTTEPVDYGTTPRARPHATEGGIAGYDSSGEDSYSPQRLPVAEHAGHQDDGRGRKRRPARK